MEVFFSGDVQGIGFRFTTVWQSKGFSVGGFVKNMPDGRVQVVAEGQRPELDKFLKRLKDVFARNIREVRENFSKAHLEFDGFDIRY